HVRWTRRTATALVVTGLVALGACSGDDDEPAADGSSTTTAAAPDDGTTVTTSDPRIGDPDPPPETATSLGTVPDELPDGTYFGYLTTLVAGDDGIVGQFDLAELLTGEAAEAAAEAAGELPLDFYVKNENPKLRRVVVDPDAVVRDIDYTACCVAQATTVERFIADRDANDERRTAVALTVED